LQITSSPESRTIHFQVPQTAHQFGAKRRKLVRRNAQRETGAHVMFIQSNENKDAAARLGDSIIPVQRKRVQFNCRTT
jgi:hypothetical protein